MELKHMFAAILAGIIEIGIISYLLFVIYSFLVAIKYYNKKLGLK